jgi:regulator of replication initiation timing
MFNWLFKKVQKDEFEQHKGAVQTALNTVKQDMTSLSKWIKHLDEQDSGIKEDVKSIGEEMNYIRQELEEIKKMMVEQPVSNFEMPLKQRQTPQHKQTAVFDIQTAVQTDVQAAFFNKLSLSEKALIMILVNSDMKLSYEDLAAMMAKDAATIRGQINGIKQKCEGLIEEQIEKNNKKRLYIPDKIKAILLKRAKVRGKREKELETE